MPMAVKEMGPAVETRPAFPLIAGPHKWFNVFVPLRL
jgi:hypothetical protein